jgi:FkbM family methyltransferase
MGSLSQTKPSFKAQMKQYLNSITHLFEKMAGKQGSEPQEPAPKFEPDMWFWLKRTASVETVIDIGANNGDFAKFLTNFFKPNQTYVFEPLPLYATDLELKKNHIPNFEVFNIALSDRAGEETFFQNSSGPSSSFLRVSDCSKTEFPDTAHEVATRVQMARLDDVLATADLSDDVFIKIDVQGFEDRVISGGHQIFSKARYVLIEMSFVPLYVGQPLFGQVHAQLANLGYELAGIKNQICANTSGQPLFAHCLYIRNA